MHDDITLQTLTEIFSNHADRESFIWNYKSFLEDDFLPFYEAFVNKNYSAKQPGMLIQVMDLAINIDFFTAKHLLHFREHYYSQWFDYRLTFLDYLYFFRQQTTQELYTAINKEIFNSARNRVIRGQACINLCAKDATYTGELMKLLHGAINAANHYVFYRALSFTDDLLGSPMACQVRTYMHDLLIKYPTAFPAGQQEEFLERSAGV